MITKRLVVPALVVAIAAPVLAAGALPLNPVMNPGFELYQDTNGSRGYADGALYWAHGYGSNARFEDVDGDGDREAVVDPSATASWHNFWQSTLPPLQVVTADFASFEFTVESGAVPASAHNQIGFSLSPSFAQHPWVGLWWEGAVQFTAASMTPDADGRVRMDPAVDGRIVCPDWQPCRDFKAAFDAADEDGRRTLLGEARLVQVSFWGFQGGSETVVIDDVALVAPSTVAEEAGNVRVAPYLE